MSTASRVIAGLCRALFGLPQCWRTGRWPEPNRPRTITTSLCVLCSLTGLAVQGQSLVNFDNDLDFQIRRAVYGVDSRFPFTQVRGDPGLFSGPLVSSNGHTAGLWGGPLGSAEDALVLLGTTTFQCCGWAGFVVPVQLPCPFALPGERATFQVRVWDNQGGTVASWEQARSGNFGPYGSSALFSPPDPLGVNPLNLVGLQSFNLVGPKSLTNFVADCTPASRSTIAWFGSPTLFIGLTVTTLDLDRNGVADISAWEAWPQCEFGPCSMPIYVSTLGANSLLTEGSYGYIFLRPAGFSIGSVVSNAAWSNPGQALQVTRSGGGPPLSLWGEGYAGVRFQAADGWHYGWLHLQIRPWQLGFPTLAVTEWAYETRPDMPICAGAKPVSVLLARPQIVAGMHLRLHWPSVIGRAYQVQSKDRLDAPTWTNLGFVVIATATNAVVDLPLNGSTRFFRIVETD